MHDRERLLDGAAGQVVDRSGGRGEDLVDDGGRLVGGRVGPAGEQLPAAPGDAEHEGGCHDHRDEASHRDQRGAGAAPAGRGRRADGRRRHRGHVVEGGPDHGGEGCRIRHPGHPARPRGGHHGPGHDVVHAAGNGRTDLRRGQHDLAVARGGRGRDGGVTGPVAGGEQVHERPERVDVRLLAIGQVGEGAEQCGVDREAADPDLAGVGDEDARGSQPPVGHVLPRARGDGAGHLRDQREGLGGGERGPVPVLDRPLEVAPGRPLADHGHPGDVAGAWRAGRGCRARGAGAGRRPRAAAWAAPRTAGARGSSAERTRMATGRSRTSS